MFTSHVFFFFFKHAGVHCVVLGGVSVVLSVVNVTVGGVADSLLTPHHRLAGSAKRRYGCAVLGMSGYRIVWHDHASVEEHSDVQTQI